MGLGSAEESEVEDGRTAPCGPPVFGREGEFVGNMVTPAFVASDYAA
jgi:hypothetical protein